MGIVRFALKYPHTFYVVAALILFLGVTAAIEMPTDIFPEIDIPVVSVIWQYTGLDTTEMEQRVTTYSQYSISSNVNGIKDIEAETVNGISVQKIYFQPDVNLDLAISQIVAATNSIRALMPTGIEPPVVVQYSASAVPVLQISLSSDSLSQAAALRLRHLPAAADARTDPRRHIADARRRQVPADHGRHRPDEASRQGPDAAAGGQCGQRAEPDPARRRRRRSARPITPSAPIRCRRRSRRSTTSRSVIRTAPPCSSGTSVMSATAIWCSRTSSGPTASARCCSASSKTAMPRH